MSAISAPDIDWSLARRIGLWTGGELPAVSRSEAARETASLRLAAFEARDLVARQFGPPGLRHDVAVVDREGWRAGAESMVEGFVAAMGLVRRRRRWLTPVRRAAFGMAVGIGLGVAGRQLLGQYDPLGRRLFLVAPTIYATRHRHGIGAGDFHLWVCLHEQTHAAQFAAAPWLRDHFVGLLMQAADGKRLNDTLALMTFLEGHADLVTDRAAARRISSVAALRTAFRRPAGPRRRGLWGALDKSAQYRDGLAFCRAATKRRRHALNAAFEDPANLPTLDGIANASAWLERVHG